jgi:hydrogenase nickel incorporation protein HypB
MCKDCGCEEGNARAYFQGHDHEHDHGDEAHVHVHVHVHLHGAAVDHDHSQVHVPTHDEHDHEHTHEHPHAHEHRHTHEHPPAHEHPHDPAPAAAHARTVQVEERVLAKNDEAAAANRAWLAERGVLAVNLISSPGSGKTELLVQTLQRLHGRLASAVIVGDQQTDNDARRLQGHGAPVRQIETGAACHLNASQVGAVLPEVVGAGVRLLFVENVGNLVCPAAFDLGERFKIAVLSVTEGEDKPLKYPVLFSDAPVVVVTKADLLPHLDVSLDVLRANLKRVRPDVTIFELSAKTGQGLDVWIEYLESVVSRGA